MLLPGPEAQISGGTMREAFGGSTIRLSGKLSRDLAVDPNVSRQALFYEWRCRTVETNVFCSQILEKGMIIKNRDLLSIGYLQKKCKTRIYCRRQIINCNLVWLHRRLSLSTTFPISMKYEYIMAFKNKKKHNI